MKLWVKETPRRIKFRYNRHFVVHGNDLVSALIAMKFCFLLARVKGWERREDISFNESTINKNRCIKISYYWDLETMWK